MKRLSAVLLCCLALFAAACTGGSGGETSPNGAADVPETQSQAAATQAASATEAAEEKSYCVDYKNITFNPGTIYPTFAETDDALYLLNITDHILYFTDKEYKDWMPLCAKPDCRHKGKDCNAYIDSGFIALYDKYLYYFQGGGTQFLDEKPKYKVDLCRMALDGSSHETVSELREQLEPEHEYRVSSASWTAQATGKYLLIRVGLLEESGQGEVVTHNYYYSWDLDTMQFVPVLSEYSEKNDFAGFTMLEGSGSHAYGFIGSKEATDVVIADIDLASGETRRIGEFGGKIAYWERGAGILDGKLCFCNLDDPSEEMYYDDDEPSGVMVYGDRDLLHLYSMDLETGELELIAEEAAKQTKWYVLDTAEGCWYSTISPNEDGEKGFGVYGLDGSLIDFIPASDYPDGMSEFIVLGRITEDYIFAVLRKGYSYSMADIPLWYLSKADIGTDDLMWRKWEP